jgi:hypothetical protein
MLRPERAPLIPAQGNALGIELNAKPLRSNGPTILCPSFFSGLRSSRKITWGLSQFGHRTKYGRSKMGLSPLLRIIAEIPPRAQKSLQTPHQKISRRDFDKPAQGCRSCGYPGSRAAITISTLKELRSVIFHHSEIPLTFFWLHGSVSPSCLLSLVQAFTPVGGYDGHSWPFLPQVVFGQALRDSPVYKHCCIRSCEEYVSPKGFLEDRPGLPRSGYPGESALKIRETPTGFRSGATPSSATPTGLKWQ